jgi:hypothetical protein
MALPVHSIVMNCDCILFGCACISTLSGCGGVNGSGPCTDLIEFGLPSGQCRTRTTSSRVQILNGSRPVTPSNSSHPAIVTMILVTMEPPTFLIILNHNSSHMTWAINTTMAFLYMVGIPRRYFTTAGLAPRISVILLCARMLL